MSENLDFGGGCIMGGGHFSRGVRKFFGKMENCIITV